MSPPYANFSDQFYLYMDTGGKKLPQNKTASLEIQDCATKVSLLAEQSYKVQTFKLLTCLLDETWVGDVNLSK